MTEEQYRWAMIILCSVFIGAFIVLGIRFTGTRAASKRSQEKNMNRIQLCVAIILALFAAVAIPCVFYLVYIFPKTLAMLADQGDDLSSVQGVVVELSQLCQPAGLLILPALFFAVIGCVIWAVHAGKRQQHEGKQDE